FQHALKHCFPYLLQQFLDQSDSFWDVRAHEVFPNRAIVLPVQQPLQHVPLFDEFHTYFSDFSV
ncbi:MAG: hypothetical protein AAB802_00130, partial [Patescibacteria group bacterium]